MAESAVEVYKGISSCNSLSPETVESRQGCALSSKTDMEGQSMGRDANNEKRDASYAPYSFVIIRCNTPNVGEMKSLTHLDASTPEQFQINPLIEGIKGECVA